MRPYRPTHAGGALYSRPLRRTYPQANLHPHSAEGTAVAQSGQSAVIVALSKLFFRMTPYFHALATYTARRRISRSLLPGRSDALPDIRALASREKPIFYVKKT